MVKTIFCYSLKIVLYFSKIRNREQLSNNAINLKKKIVFFFFKNKKLFLNHSDKQTLIFKLYICKYISYSLVSKVPFKVNGNKKVSEVENVGVQEHDQIVLVFYLFFKSLINYFIFYPNLTQLVSICFWETSLGKL